MSDQQQQAAGGGQQAAGSGQQAAGSGQQGQQPAAAPKGAGEGLLAFVDPAAADGQQAAGSGQQGQQPAAQQKPGIGHNQGPDWLPDGVPEAMRGKDAKETIGKLVAGLPAPPPAKAEDYKLELAPEMARVVGDLANDKAVSIFKSIAHEAKLSPAQFNGVVGKFLKTMSEEGLIAPAIDPEAELMKLAPRRGTPDERRIEAQRVVTSAYRGINQLKADKHLSGPEANILHAVLMTAEGVTAIQKIVGLLAEKGIQTNGSPGSAASPADDQQRRIALLYPSMSQKAS